MPRQALAASLQPLLDDLLGWVSAGPGSASASSRPASGGRGAGVLGASTAFVVKGQHNQTPLHLRQPQAPFGDNPNAGMIPASDLADHYPWSSKFDATGGMVKAGVRLVPRKNGVEVYEDVGSSKVLRTLTKNEIVEALGPALKEENDGHLLVPIKPKGVVAKDLMYFYNLRGNDRIGAWWPDTDEPLSLWPKGLKRPPLDEDGRPLPVRFGGTGWVKGAPTHPSEDPMCALLPWSRRCGWRGPEDWKRPHIPGDPLPETPPSAHVPRPALGADWRGVESGPAPAEGLERPTHLPAAMRWSDEPAVLKGAAVEA